MWGFGNRCWLCYYWKRGSMRTEEEGPGGMLILWGEGRGLGDRD